MKKPSAAIMSINAASEAYKRGYPFLLINL